MGLRVRKLALRMTTSVGDYGTDVDFPDGLVVLRADNSAGKSTCVQAIFYALGLEGMWSSSHDVPLPHAMTDHLDDGGRAVAVVSSEAWLEVGNGKGEILTVRRLVKGAGGSTRLISAWNGPKLSSPETDCEQEDFFVREPGAATRPRGFHHRLAAFIGWELPSVGRFSGEDGPLYLECIFPTFVVEQKRGWSSLQARVPTHYRIRDVYRRAIEFLLRLDAHENAQRRHRLQREIEQVREGWSGVISACAAIAGQINGIVTRPVQAPVEDWDAVEEPSIQVYRDRWVPIAEALASDRAALEALRAEELPRVEQVQSEVASRLAEREVELKQREFQLGAAYGRLEAERGAMEGIDLRLAALADDLRKNQDVLKLRNLGSVSVTGVVSGHCPTCHQPITDSLLPAEAGSVVMSVEENVEFIKAQVETFRAAKDDSSRTVEAAERMVIAHRQRFQELQGEVRDLRRSLIADGRLPSLEALRKQIVLEERVGQAARSEQAFAEQLEKLQALSERWAEAQTQLRAIPAGNLSDADRAKLRKVEGVFQAQLREYGFTSVPPDSVSISQDSYHPEHEGFDLDFDLSASDMVRAIWAYFYSFLALARDEGTNHPGLLVFDEPRQQETARSSFEALIRRVATAEVFNQQVIIATSEEADTVRQLLRGLPHVLFAVEGKILKRLPAGRP